MMIIALAAGVYFITGEINELATSMKNLEMQMALITKEKTETPTPSEGEEVNEENEETENPSGEPVNKIPTSIIFSVKSSSALMPRTDLLVAINEVRKLEDGRIALEIRIYSWQANSYSALDTSIFELVSLTGGNQKPISVTGQFNSIPPKSSITGNIFFRPLENESKIIIQIRADDDLFFYEFDLERGSYEETSIG